VTLIGYSSSPGKDKCLIYEFLPNGTLEEALEAWSGPAIVIATAGHINSGAFDYVGAIAEMTRSRGAWLHVDAAFLLWARAVPACDAISAGLMHGRLRKSGRWQ